MSESIPYNFWGGGDFLMGEGDSYYRNEAFRFFQEGYDRQTEGEIEEAIALYQKSIEIYPTPEAYTFLGWAYSFQGRYDEAIEECRRAIDLDPDYGNPYNDIGAYLMEKGKLDDAIPWFEKAIHAKRYEAYCYPHYNLGRVWERKGEWEKARLCYQNSLHANPEYTLAKRAWNRLQGMMN